MTVTPRRRGVAASLFILHSCRSEDNITITSTWGKHTQKTFIYISYSKSKNVVMGII